MKKIFFTTLLLLCLACSCSSDDDLKVNNQINGHEYVDLGLSVKWATCNVGASQPSDYGNHYCWASVTPDEFVGWDNISHQITKISGSEYDVAHIDWKGTWRMPTDTEMEELIKKCTWEWTSLNGVNGYKVIGSNGNSIFLPAASCTHMIPEYGVNGYYWTSTRCPEEYDYDAWGLYFTEEHNLINGWNLPNLFSVRPVSE